MGKTTNVVKGAGSEPVLKREQDHDTATLTWGRWSFDACVELSLYAGSLCYVIKIDVHGDHDSGERGMYGPLTTGPGMTLEEACATARMLRLTVQSEHCEDGDDDWCLYERTIDFGPLVDLVAQGVLDAVKAEAKFIREHVDKLPADPKAAALDELEDELLRLRRSGVERQAMLEIYGKMIAELLPDATTGGEPDHVECARKFSRMMVRKYLGLPTLGELVQRGVPVASRVTEQDREMKLVSMKAHRDTEGCIYDAVFMRERT